MAIAGAPTLREALQHDLFDNRCVQRRCGHVAPGLAIASRAVRRLERPSHGV